MESIELHAAYSILERGIRAKVKAPLFFRMLGKKTVSVTISRLYAGTLLKIVPIWLSTGIKQAQLDEIPLEDGLKLMELHGKSIARCVAIAVINRRYDFGMHRILAWYLLGYMDWKMLLKMLEVVLIYSGVGDFMSITRLIQASKITAPNQNLGQKKKGS